ncbi:MAG: LOW QUALITY PROTEIN: hypothetical protein BJ554DRAFT_6618 [Olpidium bornovanus]|uniref:ubiquitinyl hydrolase 1 n=1 Tax=Olpidium bornovanus TaxID=278681 RepID=A0A8H7ZXK5_9FUNG|nr:MAG: LOW QUALITY PROTEIN: hypothetical protein BJ554DRAFT_6618 [Olpidium bornovanus]
MQQDAHEFLNYVLNTIADNVQDMEKQVADALAPKSNGIFFSTRVRGEARSGSFLQLVLTTKLSRQRSAKTSLLSIPQSITNGGGRSTATVPNEHPPPTQQQNHQQLPQQPPGGKTWVHTIFEGVLTNETKCLTCETVTNKDESFLDLSVDIEQYSSVSACLRQFSVSEMLCNKNKFFCDACNSLQEADKRMKIKRLPNVLALHLKRFKYQEKLGKYVKLSYRVAFPLELRLPNTPADLFRRTSQADCVEFPDRLYSLFGFVVHLGTGPYHGHYISVIKSLGRWLVFDDTNVQVPDACVTVQEIDEADIEKYYGDLPGTGSCYVLFYEANDLTADDPETKTMMPSQHSPDASPLFAVSSSTSSSTSDVGAKNGGGGPASSTSSSFEQRISLSSSVSQRSEDLGEGQSVLVRHASLPILVNGLPVSSGVRKNKEGGFSWFATARKGKRRKEKGRKKDGKRETTEPAKSAGSPPQPTRTSISSASSAGEDQVQIRVAELYGYSDNDRRPKGQPSQYPWFSRERRKAKNEMKERKREAKQRQRRESASAVS